MTDTKIYAGRTFDRVSHNGGWLERGAKLPKGSTAKITGDALVFKEAAQNMYGGVFRGGWFHTGAFHNGVFHGGEFHNGVFRGGEFHAGKFHAGEFRGGVFRGGVFRGGEFHDGVFYGGWFYGGEFHGGSFHNGVFRGGEFHNGVFHGGEFRSSPSCAQRSDGYMFVAKIVGGELRIWAGCRNFSWDEAVDHWNDDHTHGPESQRIIHFLKAQEEAKEQGT